MGRPCFNKLLLVSLLLLLCFSHGFGARQLTESVDSEEDSTVQFKEAGGESRQMIEVMDYEDPHSNNNPRGYIISPPPPA